MPPYYIPQTSDQFLAQRLAQEAGLMQQQQSIKNQQQALQTQRFNQALAEQLAPLQQQQQALELQKLQQALDPAWQQKERDMDMQKALLEGLISGKNPGLIMQPQISPEIQAARLTAEQEGGIPQTSYPQGDFMQLAPAMGGLPAMGFSPSARDAALKKSNAQKISEIEARYAAAGVPGKAMLNSEGVVEFVPTRMFGGVAPTSVTIKDQSGDPLKASGLSSTGSSATNQLSPEAIQAVADRYAATGELPSLGMGAAASATRFEILNRYAQDMGKTGTSMGDQLAKQAAFKASKAELAQLQRQRGPMLAFANLADKNLDLVEQLSEKVDRTGVPFINKWILAGKREVEGDPAASEFNAAIRAAINEVAKVTSSATGGGVTSDSARKEIEGILNSAQSPEQVKAVVGILRKELANRKSGYDMEINRIKESLGATPSVKEADADSVKAGKAGTTSSGIKFKAR